MSKLSRSAFLAKFGATQANTVWAWAAVNHDEKVCYFSAWTDKRMKDSEGRPYYVVQEEFWGRGEGHDSSKLGRNDQDEKFDLAFNHGYSSRIYFIDPVDPSASPREIKTTRTTFVFKVDLVKESGRIIAYPRQDGRIETPK